MSRTPAKTPAKPRPSKRTLDSYTIKGSDGVINPGDAVLMKAPDSSKRPYVARVEEIQATGPQGSKVKVKVRWYYRPEESMGGRRPFHGSKEVFLSDHQDVQSADTIECKCNVYTFKEYTKLDTVNAEDYFCRFEYKSLTGSFVPDRIAVFCKCEMPYNPDDLMIQCDECSDCKARHCAKRGGNVGANGTMSSRMHNGAAGETLRIPVPVGTVVRRKKGSVLADLAHPGDQVLVARGGQGGISLIDAPEYRRGKAMALSPNVMRDVTDKVLTHGQPGEEISLELILRVVADVGLVGLPNAGKSTLLSAITLAKPDIADYPFTTLMPNLGRLGGDPSLGALQFSSGATLADLPGLIEGAHLGKGLGRNFLRHLRRTRVIVHVVDAAADDPVTDYKIVREELRMYNPKYLERPYVVVLNKIDLPKAQDRLSSLAFEISSVGCEECHDKNSSIEKLTENKKGHHPSEGDNKQLGGYPRPHAVIGASVLRQIGIDEMLKEIRTALAKCSDRMSLEP